MISIIHIVDFCRSHLSVQVEIEKVFFKIDCNEFVLSMPVHQFLKMNSHFLANFVVNRNHVSTIMFEVEILSSSARDLCSTAQNLPSPVSRFIFTHSNRFGLHAAQRSKPPSEKQLAEVSYVCSQPSCHPTTAIVPFVTFPAGTCLCRFLSFRVFKT